ncbi:MAG: hypothetical protein Q4B10_02405 [Actinomycetaceae bacterium]|nr:hypothetical protein [Actinomycetaceae bacterium]
MSNDRPVTTTPKKPRGKHVGLIMGALLALVAAVVVVALLLWPHTDGKEADAHKQSAPTTSAPAEATTTPSANEAQTAPASEDVPQADRAQATRVLEEAPSHFEAHVAQGAQEHYGYTDPKQVMPEGTKLDVDESTWTKVDDNTVMVKVTLTRPGEAPTPYAAIMARQDASQPWKIVGTLDWHEDTAQ